MSSGTITVNTDQDVFPDFPLNGKIVAITGGGSGLGLEFAKLAHSKGARGIVIADLKLTPDAEAFIQDANTTKENCVVHQRCDVTKRVDLEGVIEKSKEAFGDVPDVYLPAAGVFEPPFSNFWDDPLEEPTLTHGYAQVDINAAHPIRFTRLAIRALLSSNKKGVVLLIASNAGLTAPYAFPLYAATKWAIVGFGRSMEAAAKLQGVKVVTICPGVVRTPMVTSSPSIVSRLIGTTGTYLEPSHIASRMAALVESSVYRGGTVLEVVPELPEEDGNARVVPLYGATPGPETALKKDGERVARILEPVLEVTRRERAAL